MKKGIILLLLIFPILTTMGQGGDGEFMGQRFIDSKTGDTIRTTFWRMLDISPRYIMYFRMGRINSKITFELTGTSLTTIKQGDSLWIKFLNGYTITLYAQECAKINSGENMITGDMEHPSEFSIAVKYGVPFDKVLALSGNEIEKIRIYSSLGKVDIEVRKEYRPTTIKAANLMIEKRKFKVKDNKNDDTW
jgi:hypothetical protein